MEMALQVRELQTFWSIKYRSEVDLMKQLFLMVNDGTVKLIESPVPRVKENHVIVETLYSVVSAGTERGLTSFGGKNLVQKALERPDQVKSIGKNVNRWMCLLCRFCFTSLKEPMPWDILVLGKL